MWFFGQEIRAVVAIGIITAASVSMVSREIYMKRLERHVFDKDPNIWTAFTLFRRKLLKVYFPYWHL